MRDISHRLKRYRLSRYAPPADPIRRHLRWGWLAAAAWLVYIGAVSDHSLYRIWRLSQDTKQAEAELTSMQTERERLESESNDPAWREDRVEQQLREKDMMARPKEIIYQIREVPPDSLQH
jgi:cell division protein FtsB